MRAFPLRIKLTAAIGYLFVIVGLVWLFNDRSHPTAYVLILVGITTCTTAFRMVRALRPPTE